MRTMMIFQFSPLRNKRSLSDSRLLKTMHDDDMLDKSSRSTSTLSTTGMASFSSSTLAPPLADGDDDDDELSAELFDLVVKKDHEDDDANNNMSTTTKHQDQRHVSFGKLEINEHVVDISAGGLPGSGAPVGIGWERQARYEVDLMAYEDLRPRPPRRGEQMLLTRKQRSDMLLDWGVTMSELKRQTAHCDELRKQRSVTARKNNGISTMKSVIQRLSLSK